MTTESVLANFVDAVQDDARMLGVLLHGSRANGQPGWYTATYLAARVAFDRNGDIETTLARMRAEADRVARENTATAYDGYLNNAWNGRYVTSRRLLYPSPLLCRSEAATEGFQLDGS